MEARKPNVGIAEFVRVTSEACFGYLRETGNSPPHENTGLTSMIRTYPQGTPILALLDHLTDAVNDIEDPQAGLEGVNRFV